MTAKQSSPEVEGRGHPAKESAGVVIITRIFGLLVMLAGVAMIIVPLISGAGTTLTLFAFLFSGVGCITIGYGLLQVYLWGLYLLIVADFCAIVSLIFTYKTLPFFKSFFIILCLIIAGYFIVNREIFKQSKII
ncbi:MAG TPA: hypothetical protein VKA68_08235 [bacterium]|nr:hypothetical protein [bacterium]